jgi:hypothetical protein
MGVGIRLGEQALPRGGMASVMGDLQGGQGVGPPAAVSALRMGLGLSCLSRG